MTDRLSIYNGALRSVGERRLANLTENYESRYLLDDVWDNDFLSTVLQMGQWDFAIRSTRLDYDPSITPEFGAQYAFARPDDHVRTVGVSADEYFTPPLLDYTHEGGLWYAETESIYVRYVSNAVELGGDYSLWPPNFTRYVEHWIGLQILPSLTQAESTVDSQEKKVKQALKRARNTDAQENPAKFAPESSWARSRKGRFSRRRMSGFIHT